MGSQVELTPGAFPLLDDQPGGGSSRRVYRKPPLLLNYPINIIAYVSLNLYTYTHEHTKWFQISMLSDF